VCDLTDVANDEICITASVNQFVLFGEKLRIKRTIRSTVGENTILLKDEIENCGGSPVPYMLLYHVNFGYPLLDSCARIFVNSNEATANNEYSEADMDNLFSFSEPDAQNREKNYTHSFSGISEGYAEIYNEEHNLGVHIKFPAEKLPYLTQWKMEGVRDYILALEPANAPCISRKDLREQGRLPFLQPGQATVNELEIGIKINRA
jgi:hypothetical protein